MIRLRLTDDDGVRIQALLRATNQEADRSLLADICGQIESQARNARDDDDDDEEGF